MDFLKKIWAWLDGNKTLIGTLLLVLLQQGVVPEHTFVYDFLSWVANILVGGGLVHKIAKGTSNTGK